MQSISIQLEQLYLENSRNGNWLWWWDVAMVCVCVMSVCVPVCSSCVCVCVCLSVCVCVYRCPNLTLLFTDMNSVVTEVLLKSCITPAMLSDRFMLEHCMLLTLLHCHLGSEVGKWVCLPPSLFQSHVNVCVCVFMFA